MARAGARKTKEGPCIKGSLDPNEECNNVVIPQTKNTVETTFAMSSYNPKTNGKKDEINAIHIDQSGRDQRKSLTCEPPIAGTMTSGTRISEPNMER